MSYEERIWNARLIEYMSGAVTNRLRQEDVDKLLFDLIGFNNEKAYSDRYRSKQFLIRAIGGSEHTLELIAEKFNCQAEDIYVGDLSANDIKDGVFPYSVVVGNLDFSDRAITLDGEHFVENRNSVNKDMQKLKAVIGNADFFGSGDYNLQNLLFVSGDFKVSGSRNDFKVKVIGGDATFSMAFIDDASSLTYVGGNLECSISTIEDMSSLKEVKGSVLKLPKDLAGLPSLEKVGKDLILFDPSCKIKSFPKLKKINGEIEFKHCSRFLSAYMKFKFKKTLDGYVRKSIKCGR